jgi:hypothetical protein
MARSSMTGKSMTLARAVRDGAGANPRRARDGARFMKKKAPAAPLGYRFITMARSRMCGSSTGATAA